MREKEAKAAMKEEVRRKREEEKEQERHLKRELVKEKAEDMAKVIEVSTNTKAIKLLGKELAGPAVTLKGTTGTFH